MEQLATRGVEIETIQVYTALNNTERMHCLLEKLDAADLTVLAFPLYVDSLPAPVIDLLERISAPPRRYTPRKCASRHLPIAASRKPPTTPQPCPSALSLPDKAA